ncbi:MAG TPA: formate dehydrogenase [Burkholderiaceae bacterium]|nr:formate dehydrogenase [Burkholderiaceae bacterium]
MSQPQRPDQGAVKRRAVFAGATTVGALAAVASLLPTGPSTAPVAEAQPKELPQRGGGYALTDHVKQYYQTTRV